MEWLAESATPGVSPHRSTPTNPVRLAVAALYLLLAYAVRAYTQTSGQTDESGRDSSGERAGCVRCILFHGKIPSFEVRRRIIICLGIKSGREKRRVKSEKALSLSLSCSLPEDRIGALDGPRRATCSPVSWRLPLHPRKCMLRVNLGTHVGADASDRSIGGLANFLSGIVWSDTPCASSSGLEEEKGKGRRQVTRVGPRAISTWFDWKRRRARDRMTSDDLAPREPRRA